MRRRHTSVQRSHAPPYTHVSRFALRAAHLCVWLAAATSLGGCPGGAELENPEQHLQYFSGAPGVGGATAGAGGATGGAGAAQGGTAGAPAGSAGAGTAGGAGTGSGTWVWNANCGDLTMALKQNCARSFCHDEAEKYANLDLHDPTTLREQLVDKVAMHGDIGCNAVGTPFRACTPQELVDMGCPPGVMLINSQNLDESWLLKKMTLTTAELMGCGQAMPISPGNQPSNGWDPAGARKACYVEFFRSLAAP
jgi:hypothetical protein